MVASAVAATFANPIVPSNGAGYTCRVGNRDKVGLAAIGARPRDRTNWNLINPLLQDSSQQDSWDFIIQNKDRACYRQRELITISRVPELLRPSGLLGHTIYHRQEEHQYQVPVTSCTNGPELKGSTCATISSSASRSGSYCYKGQHSPPQIWATDGPGPDR